MHMCRRTTVVESWCGRHAGVKGQVERPKNPATGTLAPRGGQRSQAEPRYHGPDNPKASVVREPNTEGCRR